MQKQNKTKQFSNTVCPGVGWEAVESRREGCLWIIQIRAFPTQKTPTSSLQPYSPQEPLLLSRASETSVSSLSIKGWGGPTAAQWVKNLTSGVPVMAQWKWIWLVSVRMQVRSLASLSGFRIWHCCELWYKSQMQLGSPMAVAVAGV